LGVKRKVSAREIISDLKAGKTNEELMDKYGLSGKGLTSIFRKLINAGAVSEPRLRDRMPVVDDTVDLERLRREPRCYPVMSLPISDMEDLSVDYPVMDITAKGLQINGMNTYVGETRRLLLNPEGFSEVGSISFDAECKWVRADSENNPTSAGFEITSIKEADSAKLDRIIGQVTFCD
jgi:hypothetical protein